MRAHRNARRQRGFTLVEMSIVVVIVAVAGAMVLDSRPGGDQAKVDHAAAEMADAFRFARDESLRTGALYGVRVRTASDGVEVFRLDDSTNPPTKIYDVYHPVWKRLWLTRFDASSPANGVSVDKAYTYFGSCSQNRFTVFRDGGTPSCTDPIDVLLDTVDVTVSHGSASRTVTVEGIVGRVSVQ